jgi:hypothetical protein
MSDQDLNRVDEFVDVDQVAEADVTALEIPADRDPMPVYDGTAMVKALNAYRELQAALDQEMPEAIVEVHGRKFRKKIYWRTIARAFNLSVGEVRGSEELLTASGGDWGYKVTYRAVGKSGVYADGDGACMASEKFGSGDTVHNVRSHAHTRAFNRATSNLCGFGEVSADEVQLDVGGSRERGTPQGVSVKAKPSGGRQAAAKGSSKASTDNGTPTLVDSLVDGVTSKKGEGKKGPWELFIVKLTSGEAGSTFDEDMAEFAKSCQEREATVRAGFMKRGEYTNLVSLEEIRTTDPSLDEIPF